MSDDTLHRPAVQGLTIQPIPGGAVVSIKWEGDLPDIIGRPLEEIRDIVCAQYEVILNAAIEAVRLARVAAPMLGSQQKPPRGVGQA